MNVSVCVSTLFSDQCSSTPGPSSLLYTCIENDSLLGWTNFFHVLKSVSGPNCPLHLTKALSWVEKLPASLNCMLSFTFPCDFLWRVSE